MNWPDVIGAVGGVVGVVAALAVGIPSVMAARRSARAGEEAAEAARDSARTGNESAEAARDSAAAAWDSAREAAAVTAIERAREHDRLGPGAPPPSGIPSDLGPKQRDSVVPATLFGTITVPRDYRVRAEAVTDNSHSPIGLPLLLRANQPYRFAIEGWPPDRTEPRAQAVRVRFWPPADIDDVDRWTCPCDRPASEETDRSPGHWVWLAPIQYEPPPFFAAAYSA